MNSARPLPLQVATLNVRCATARGDGIHLWENRARFVCEHVARLKLDLLGVQEAVHAQAASLREALPEHAFHGVGRDDGATAGEYAGMFYRADRFETADAGHRWLAPDGSRPGPPAWDAGCTRMFSWLRLADRATGRRVLWLNTHWDHRGEVARLESSRLMRTFAAEHVQGDSLLITGDFNCTDADPPYRHLVDDQRDGLGTLVDALREVHPSRDARDIGTFHNFTGTPNGDRIDWILVDRSLHTTACEIDRTRRAEDGVYLSDHFLLRASLNYA